VAQFQVLYKINRQGLDPVIEADFYRTSGKFFEFLIDKEVVRTVQTDIILQIRRMDEEESGDDSEEGDPGASTDTILADVVERDVAMDELLTSLPGTEDLDELLTSLPGTEDLDELLASLPGTAEVLGAIETR
jgi:hypothetical protein